MYVDNLMIFSKNEIWLKYLAQAQHCLGIRIGRSKEFITSDQEAYVESILKRFNMDWCSASN